MRATDDDVTHAVIAGKFEQRFYRFFRAQAHDFGAKITGPLLVVEEMALQRRIDPMTRFVLVST